MPRGVKKGTEGQPTKAELIRKTAKSMGKTVRPSAVIAALKEQDVVVGYTQVSKALKSAGFQRKSRGGKAAAAKKSAGKKTAATNSAGEASKAQQIRDVAKRLGRKVRPRDVIAELAKDGVKVASAQVSQTLRAAGYRRKRRGKRAATVAVAAAVHSAAGNGLNVEALIAAKALIAKVGGVEAAEEAIRVLKKLG